MRSEGRSAPFGRYLLMVLAWGALLAIAASTLAPIEFRPQSPFSANWERLLSFFAAGLLFTLAYPRRLLLVLVVVLGAAIGLEILQVFTSSRHGQVRDMTIKIMGGIGGVGGGAALLYFRELMRR